MNVLTHPVTLAEINHYPLSVFIFEMFLFNPVPHGPLCPLYLMLICPIKNRADMPEDYGLRATVIAALSLRVS
jgi:hypothetical protein